MRIERINIAKIYMMQFIKVLTRYINTMFSELSTFYTSGGGKMETAAITTLLETLQTFTNRNYPIYYWKKMKKYHNNCLNGFKTADIYITTETIWLPPH